MRAIAVDDEALMLGALVSAIEASPDITEVAKFSNCEAALEYAQNNFPDIAFLDINMRGMGGLALAERILNSCPNCKIVFCTGYEEYAIPAFKLHASGYLMKPISSEDVQAEIDNIKGLFKKERLLTQGGLRRGVRASGSPQLRTGKSGSFNMGHQPRGLSRISSRGRPHPEGRRAGREPLPDHAGESTLLSRTGEE